MYSNMNLKAAWLSVVGCIVVVVSAEVRLNSNSPENVNSDRHTDTHIPSQRHSSFVGFTAWKQDYQVYDINETVTYDGIILNYGNAYDRSTHQFVCPFSGVYFVSISCRLFGYNELRVEVVKESTRVLYLLDDNTYEDNNAATDSNSGLVHCSAGERIWVRGLDYGWMDGEPGIPLSTFTVMSMYQDASNHQHTSFAGSSVSNSVDQAYISGQAISFNRVIYDEGNHFENDQFICPVDGIYFVNVNFRKTEFNSTQMGVSKNSYILLHVDDVRGRNRFTTLSNSRLFRCSANEAVSVQGTGVGEVSGGTDTPFTTFNVMLMEEETSLTDQRHLILVGFSAWKKSTQLYDTGDTIIFDGIFINVGDYYNPETSTFTCPIDGIYYVTVTLKRVLTAEDLEINVQVATSLLFRASDFFDQNPGISVTNGAIVRCFTGEEIVLKASSNGGIRGDASQALSTFTVMLMYTET